MKTISLTVIICLSACKPREETSETRFVPLSNDRLLIHRLHEGILRIDYGYQDNNNCDGKFIDSYQQQLLDSVSSALKIWLSVLADKKNIVDNFSFTERKIKNNYTLSNIFRSPHFAIVFHCSAKELSHVRFSNKQVPTIHLYYSQLWLYDEDAASDRNKYSRFTILHELGHIFGLGDTYTDPLTPDDDPKKYSEGGPEDTMGSQPLSVMSVNYAFEPYGDQEMHLGEDDIQGVRWLYHTLVEKSVSSCPEQYIYESSTNGCIPRYPLIFLAKQGNLYALHQADSWAKYHFNERDETGKTALHHAALVSKIHGSAVYEYMINNWQARDDIKDNYGETANDIFYNKITKHKVAKLKKYMQKSMIKAVDILLQSLNPVSNKLADNKIVRQLIEQTSLDINHLSDKGRSLLHASALRRKKNLVYLLLQFPEIDIDKQSQLTGETALHYAVRSSSSDIVRLLLDHGAKMMIKDRWQRTPYERAKVLIDDFRQKNRKAKKIVGLEQILKTFTGDGYLPTVQ